MLKCGLLVGDQQVGDFKFISWFYGQQKPYIRQQNKGVITQTLKERLKTIFPEIVEPYQVVFIGRYTIQLFVSKFRFTIEMFFVSSRRRRRQDYFAC